MAGCATKPPPPPTPVSGEYRPINTPPIETPVRYSPRIFDYKYTGTPEGALAGLKEIQSQLIITPAEGAQGAVSIVRLDLRQVTLERALKTIAEQSNGKFDIIYKPDPTNNVDFAYIRYADSKGSRK